MESEVPYQHAEEVPTTGDFKYDKLATIFEGQETLMGFYSIIERKNGAHVVSVADWGDINSRWVQSRIHDLYGYLIRELSEAMQELKGKPWKQTYGETDVDKFREELADSLHFFVEICITAGMTADDLFEGYFSAWQKNRKRQENGY